ncbi:hypothetical protein RB594_001337 [Gaeumannomyces avenae]
MFVAPAQQHRHAFVEHDHHHRLPSPLHRPTSPQYRSHGSAGTPSSSSLASPVGPSMERSGSEYSQSGLPAPYLSNCGDIKSEAPSSTPIDHASAAQYATQHQHQHQHQQEVRSNTSSTYSASATPTSEYSVYPASARSSSFPDHIHRSYHPSSSHSGSSGGMAQAPASPPTHLPQQQQQQPQQDGRDMGHTAPQQQLDIKSDPGLSPIDPSIAAPSPTYTHGQQYSPYGPPSQDMSHGYAHPSSGLYAQPRPDWTGYGQQHGAPLTPGHHVFPQTPTSAPPQARPNQVYSFVPIPGAQQHKRPRRRYEEIERMYKCGWNGCEKAYGTLNHLNAHVTMQSHGQKRTPEEFKEIRKEWKARKKEEEANRKAEEERQRQAAAASQNGSNEAQAGPEATQSSNGYAAARGAVQLPPIGYQPSQYPAPGSAGVQQSIPEYGAGYMHANYQPTSPYGQPNQQMYNQRAGGQQKSGF